MIGPLRINFFFDKYMREESRVRENPAFLFAFFLLPL
jgi:hypothetical protein